MLIRSLLLLVAFSATALAGSKAEDFSDGTRHLLPSVESHQNFDGSSVVSVNFPAGSRTFRYSPPPGWKIKAGGEQASFSRGNVRATLVLCVLSEKSAHGRDAGSEEELRRLEQETESKAPTSVSKSPEATVLPVKIADQTVVESTVEYQKDGESCVLQCVRSRGPSWEMEMEITGPQRSFHQVQASLLQSLCNIDIQTSKDRQVKAKLKEEKALTGIIDREKARNRSAPSRRSRGQFE